MARLVREEQILSGETVEGKTWEVDPGDLVLVESGWGKIGYTLAVVDEVSDGGDRFSLLLPAFRLSFFDDLGTDLPTLARIGKYDTQRKSRATADITRGPRNIAQRLREINPLYEPYASKIENMREPYLKNPKRAFPLPT